MPTKHAVGPKLPAFFPGLLGVLPGTWPSIGPEKINPLAGAFEGEELALGRQRTGPVVPAKQVGPICLPVSTPRNSATSARGIVFCASSSLAKLGALGERYVHCVRAGNKVPENPALSWVIAIARGEFAILGVPRAIENPETEEIIGFFVSSIPGLIFKLPLLSSL